MNHPVRHITKQLQTEPKGRTGHPGLFCYEIIIHESSHKKHNYANTNKA